MNLLLALLIIFSSIVSASTEWTYISRDEKVNRFHVTTKGKLNFENVEIANFALQDTANRIAISPFSPDGKYAVVFSFGDQDSLCVLLDLQKRSATSISLEGTPMVWNSWSPDGSYLVLTTYKGEESVLYVIPASNWQPKKIAVLLHRGAEKTELDPISTTWPDAGTFEMDAMIRCTGCSSREEEEVLRSYRVRITASSGELKAEEQAPSATSNDQ